ncbi:hypothetical protein IFR05_003071 [Cadophora sp. M221]|nr:hypothetical protein IFR05_003071 [Cadophora sp. M221]
MALSTTKTTTEVLTETGAILSLAQTLVADLSERYEYYYRQSNVNMNTALDALKPRNLGYHCNWAVRPMAMTKKNLEAPPADQPPAIRLTNPAGVVCELVEGFRDLSHPDYEQYFAEREEEQYYLAQAVKEWRDSEEKFDEYDRRLVCEEFWDRCQTQDIRRALEEQPIECEEKDTFEDDSNDDDDWDEYTFSRTSRSSSMASSISDPESIDEKQITTTNTETEHSTALEVARTNLAEYTLILNKAIAVTKAATIRAHNTQAQAPIIAKEVALKARTKLRLSHHLCFSITKLRLQMAQDGLLPDKTGFKYTSTQLNGPGSITFVGPIKKFLTARKAMLDVAFEEARKNPTIQAYGKTDFHKEVRVSIAHVTDLKRYTKGACVFLEQSRAARDKQEEEGKEVSLVLDRIFGDAERIVLIARESEEQEKIEKKKAERRAEKRAEKKVEKEKKRAEKAGKKAEKEKKAEKKAERRAEKKVAEKATMDKEMIEGRESV